MKDALSYIIASIVQDPKAVEISEENVDGIISFTVSVAKDDMGKVIGKEGKIIRAIRNVMKIPAMKQNVRINVSLANDNKPSSS